MEMLPTLEDSFPAPPPYFLSDSAPKKTSGVYIVNPCDKRPQQQTSIGPPSADPDNPLVSIRGHKTDPCRAPALMTCSFCQSQVTTEVTFRVGTFAWLMCFLFVLCGLILGCCLIPFFINHFKDACHICPHCHHVLHVERRTFFK